MGQADSAKTNGIIAVFGENDGGHSFVALCNLVEGSELYDIVPQEDVWNAADAVRDAHANVAVVPLSNSITHTEAATLTALATGEVKIIARMTKLTNHVLVALKDNVLSVEDYSPNVPKPKSAAGQQGAAAPGAPPLAEQASAAPEASGDHSDWPKLARIPTIEGLKEFVFLLRKVFSSTLIYEQTRGKLTGSDFRHVVALEHTANPVRVLLRILRETRTQDLWRRLHPSAQPQMLGSAQIQMPGGFYPSLGQQQVQRSDPIDDDFFSAALIAEGLLEEARGVCGLTREGQADGRKAASVCSQRLSEVCERLHELQINSQPPRDLPTHETTFLLVAPAEDPVTKDPFGPKSKLPWKAEVHEALAHCSWRATFLLSPPRALKDPADWNQFFRSFERKLAADFRDFDVVFDTAPELVNDRKRKPKLLVTARFERHGSALEARAKWGETIQRRLSDHLRRQDSLLKEADSTSGMAWSKPEARDLYGAKLLGVYPAWSYRNGAWGAEADATKALIKKEVEAPSGGAAWAILVPIIVLTLLFTIGYLTSPLFQAFVDRLIYDLIVWIGRAFPGPQR